MAGPYVTADGLSNSGTAEVSIPDINWTVSAGLPDVITAAYNPANVALTDGLALAFRATQTNTTSTPTFSPDNLAAHPITKQGGAVLAVGDIKLYMEMIVRYNLVNTRWEWVNR